MYFSFFLKTRYHSTNSSSVNHFPRFIFIIIHQKYIFTLVWGSCWGFVANNMGNKKERKLRITLSISMYANSPRLLGSLIQSQSPTLLYRWPKLLDKKRFWSVAYKKLRFKLHNSKIIWLLMLVLQFLASFICVMHIVHCKQKEESFFFATPI